MFRSVPGRSVRPGAGRSRPGRRSDDGHMILPRVQLRLGRTAEQVFLDSPSEFEPPAFSLLQDDKLPPSSPGRWLRT